MNRILVVLTIDTDHLPPNFPDILAEERKVVAQWKEEGFLEQLYLRPTRNGAVLILKNTDEAQAHELLKTLPFYAIRKSLEVIPILLDQSI
jgi:muconolactone delta-isomerase